MSVLNAILLGLAVGALIPFQACVGLHLDQGRAQPCRRAAVLDWLERQEAKQGRVR